MKLIVWKSAKDLAVKVYQLTQAGKFKTDFGLRDQIQRSAVSIPSNIAEGDESGSNRLSIRHFYVSKGSAAELSTQLIIACEIGYIDEKTQVSLCDECDKVSSMLTNLIKARSKTT